MNTGCVFCKIIERSIPSQIVKETDDIIVIKDIAPKAKIHYLIIPKKHIKDLQSIESSDCCLASKMLMMAKKLSDEIEEAKDFKIIMNNGYKAGQRVFHMHLHFIAGHNIPDCLV